MARADSPSRIVIVNDASRARGGATGLALASARLMRGAGHAVTLICGDAGDNPDLRAIGVEVVALGSAGLMARGRGDALIRGIHNRAARAMVAEFIRRHDDPRTVYHLHGWAQILSPAVLEALAPVAARTVIHAHDMFLACPNGVYMNYRSNRVCELKPLGPACLATNCDKRAYAHKLWRVMRQRALRRALMPAERWAAILPIHPAMVPRLARAGLPEALFQVVRNPARPFSETRIAAERNRGLVYVGRLERDKGALDLARAAARTGMALTLIGEGSLRPQLAAEFPQFPVTGWVPRDEIGRLAAGARALVMPSHHPEPFALVIPEASQSGLPVLVAKTALMAGEVDAGGLGFVFDVFDPASLDAALVRIRDLDDAALRAMSLRGHAREVPLALTEAAWLGELQAVYRAALGAAAGRVAAA